MNLDRETLVKAIIELIRRAVTQLPADVVIAIDDAAKKEQNSVALSQLETIQANVKMASATSAPLCQDTGVITFFVKIGTQFPVIKTIPSIFEEAVRRATEEIPLRPNTVSPLTNKNYNANMGPMMPWINWEIVSGSDLTITILPKGGGSENMARLTMLSPSEGLAGVKTFVIDSIIEAGGKPCPPILVGVGIGGGADIVMKLAKKALLRPINQMNPDPVMADLERWLLNAINKTGIGPMGLGGETTALAVHVEYTARHPASFPVGLIIQCWAARQATLQVNSSGAVEYFDYPPSEEIA